MDNASGIKATDPEITLAGEIQRNFIKARLDRRTLLEQAAEEASELTQTLLKLIRAEKLNNNPTPLDSKEALLKVEEEFNDLKLVMEMLGFNKFDEWQEYKTLRWSLRLMAEEGMYEFCQETEKKE